MPETLDIDKANCPRKDRRKATDQQLSNRIHNQKQRRPMTNRRKERKELYRRRESWRIREDRGKKMAGGYLVTMLCQLVNISNSS
jgi:hypothetical protein